MSASSQLREALRKQVLMTERSALLGENVDAHVVVDNLVDAVIASLPKPSVTNTGEVAGRIDYYLQVKELLQSAKSDKDAA